MRICLVGKYPPIQGGVAAHTMWLSRWLADLGHEVHVVTNGSEVERGYRVRLRPQDEEWLRAPARLTIHETAPLSWRYQHIPQSNPFVTKLASLAASVLAESAIDVIVSYYYEPYAVAAYLASVWYGVPLVVRNAGSDLGRLAGLPQLGRAYSEILRRASMVCAGPTTADRLLTMGVPESSLYPDPGFVLPRDVFHPDVDPLDLNALLAELEQERGSPGGAGERWSDPGSPVDPSIPSIGVYGKLGERKGIYDLVAVLGQLKRRGHRLNLIAAVHGRPDQEERLRSALLQAGIRDDTRILPFLPHWRVPGLIRSLTAVCFLENRFPIATHAPGVPQEVLACGTALIVSTEAARKQPFAPRMLHGRNCLTVRDPEDHDELREALRTVLDDPGRAAEIGAQGSELLRPAVPWQVCARRHEQMLAEAVAAGGPERPPRSGARGFVLRRFFPWTTHLLQVAGLGERLPQTAAGAEDTARRAVTYGERLAELLEAGALPAWCQQVLRWEVLKLPRSTVRARDTDRLFFRGAVDAGADPSWVPTASPNVICAEFPYDMEELLAFVREAAAPLPSTRPEQRCSYAFHYLPRPRVVWLPPLQHAVFLLCDGTRTVGEVEEELGQVLRSGDAGAAERGGGAPEAAALGAAVPVRIRAAVEDLFREGLIDLERRPGDGQGPYRRTAAAATGVAG